MTTSDVPTNGEKTILITGGAGFIGSHLAELMLDKGHRVEVIDNLSTGSLENIRHLLTNPHFDFARADVTEAVVLDRMASQADIIVHLAAAVGVQLVVERPVHTIETNVMGTDHVLRAALRYGARVLVASTSEVYGKGTKVPFAEEDDVVLGPTSKSRWGYAASKMVDEFLTLAYVREYGLDAVAMRFFNTVGPRQSGRYGMVIPRFVRQAVANEPLTVYGDGQQSRCFCDVHDVVRAVAELALTSNLEHHVYNIGGTEEITIEALARFVKVRTGSPSEVVFVPYGQAYAPGFEDMRRRVPDTTRIQDAIGWQPTVDLAQTVDTVISQFER
ncbi:MAG: nucleoside-diphosphate sugar epimerase [Anaerolineaceae bacterium]|nr:nucleoside-diphosphate sugar epimerase [Anaerolineaceae bacterium]